MSSDDNPVRFRGSSTSHISSELASSSAVLVSATALMTADGTSTRFKGGSSRITDDLAYPLSYLLLLKCYSVTDKLWWQSIWV